MGLVKDVLLDNGFNNKQTNEVLFGKTTESELTTVDLWTKIYYSLTGFYKKDYDKIDPEEIYNLYIRRKEYNITHKHPTQNKNKVALQYDIAMLGFAKQFKNTIIGFFRDKQLSRGLK
jgi:hypothetical protein